MTTWFTSDHHFGHKNIQKYENRPDDWQSRAVDHWNERVKDDDIVIHLGDFVFSSVAYAKVIMNELRGHKYIILGNHDRSPQNMLDMGFEQVFGHRKHAKYGENQFWMRWTMEPNFGRSYPVCLSHAPLSELRGFSQFNLHGHTHSNPNPVEIGHYDWHVNCSVDVADYYPISADEIILGYRGIKDE
jgi:calcineurin-like phosphoesterase family protein